MERAKRIATAFIGVAFAVNYCEPAIAQTPNRFIRQPVKAPVTPAPATPASIEPDAQAPDAQAPVAQAPVAQAPVAPVATVQPAPDKSAAALEAEVAKQSAKLSINEPQSGAKPDAPLSFPSILTLVDTPDLIFDSLESFATVPADLGSEKPTIQILNLDTQSGESKLRTLVPGTSPSLANSARPVTPPRSGQLQWTARANVTHSRSEPSNSNAGSQPQFDFAPIRSTPSFNTCTNTSTLTPFSQPDFQSAKAAKQQTDSTNELLNRIVDRVESIETKVEKSEEPAKQDRIRASLVSARITNDPRFASQSQFQSSVARIESPQGWQAIGARLSDHVRKCESLLSRGAFCSAREEAETASMLLFRHIDLHDNLFRCEPAVQSANQALREAEDFLVALRSTADGESIRRLVDAHETPVLKNKSLTGMSPLTAGQHYRQFAESQLIEAAQGHPWASELLYTVGRTYQEEADADSKRVDVLRMKAMAYYRASRATLPSNAITCNQLGYLLLKMDRNAEAREALVAAVTLKQDEAFLSNLAEASRRLGDNQTVAWATQSVAAIRSRTPPPSHVPSYVEVSQEDFIAISPREIGPKTRSELGPNISSQSAVRSAATPNASQLR